MKASFIICLFLLLGLSSSHWTVSVLNEDGQKGEISLRPGKYTKIYLKFESSLKIDFPTFKGDVELDYDESDKSVNFIKTESSSYEIKSYLSKQYEVYIGFSYSQDVSALEGKTFNMKFKGPTGLILDKNIYESFTVKILPKEKLNFNLEYLLTKIPKGGYSAFKLKDTLLNVDSFAMIFKPKSEYSSIEITPLNFPAFKSKDAAYDSYNGIIGYYGHKGQGSNGVFEFDITYDGESVYEVKEKTFSFEVTDETVKEMEDADKKSIIASFSKETPEEMNTIEFSFEPPKGKYPSFISCSAFNLDISDESIEDIVAHSKTETYLHKYYTNIVTSGERFHVKISELSRLFTYRIKCVYYPYLSPTQNNIVFSVGRFLNSDIIDELRPSLPSNAPAQCATFNFGSAVNVESFNQNAVEYCQSIMGSGESRILSKLLKSTMTCEKVSTGSLTQAKICASLGPITFKPYTGDAKALFRQFVDDLNSKDKIKEKLDISGFDVKSTSIEIDERAPRISNIETTIQSTSATQIKFNIKNEESQPIECKFNKGLVYSILRKFIQPQQLKDSFVVNGKSSYDLTVTGIFGSLTKKYSAYPLIMSCNFLPNYDGYFHTTGPYIAATAFYSNQKLPEDYDPKAKVDCSKDKNHPMCIIRDIHSLITKVRTGLPEIIYQIEDEVEQFAGMAENAQKYLLETAKAELAEALEKAKPLTEILQTFIKITKMLVGRNCYLSKNYDKCREEKKEFLNYIFTKLNGIVSCELTNLLKDNEHLYELIQEFLVLLNDISNNPDAFVQGMADKLKEYTSCVTDSLDVIMKDFRKQVSTITDGEIEILDKQIKELISSLYHHLSEEINFEELDGYIKENIINSDFGLKVTEERLKMKQQIEKQIKTFLNEAKEFNEFHMDEVHSLINTLNETSKKVSYEIKETAVKINAQAKALHDQFKAAYFEITNYEVYPLINQVEQQISKAFVSLNLYAKDKTKIIVQNIAKEYLPEILFPKIDPQVRYEACYYFDEIKNQLVKDGLIKETRVIDGIEYAVCEMTHFTDFTVGPTEKPSEKSGLSAGIIVLIVFLVIAVLAAGFFAYIHFHKAKEGSERFVEQSKSTV
ncbi:MAG: hypothetical protein MJ252_17255 [archaeon]|nr:hypothetical protein [archaeon]